MVEEKKKECNKREQAKIAFVSCSLSEQILFTFKLHRKYPKEIHTLERQDSTGLKSCGLKTKWLAPTTSLHLICVERSSTASSCTASKATSQRAEGAVLLRAAQG